MKWIEKISILDDKKINKVIFNFWNNFLNFKEIPNKWTNLVIKHDLKSKLTNDEIYIISFYDKWNILSVPELYFSRISKYLQNNTYNISKLLKEFKLIKNEKIKKVWPVISYYLYWTEKLFSKSINVRKLKWNIDKNIFEKYIESCSKEEVDNIDMDFNDLTHEFFWLFINNTMVSVWNYSIDKITKIAHIWIITNFLYTKKWYWKVLVNTMVINILEEQLIPQYRVDKDNIASIKIAKSLWFIWILEGISLITITT